MLNVLRPLLRSGRAMCMMGLALIMLVILAAGARAQIAAKPTFVTGDAMITVPRGTPGNVVNDIAVSVGANVLHSFPSIDYLNTRDAYHLRIRSKVTDQQTLAAIDKLKADVRVSYAGPSRLKYLLDSTPNDPRFKEQWHLTLINMPQAWDIEKGQSNVIIAVLDSGCDITHEDLKDRIYKPINVVTGGTPTDLTDDVPHGTHVLGIAGASTDNSIGVSGVTWQNVKMMPVKVGTASGISDADIISGLVYADTNGATVVNISIGGISASDTPDLTDPLNAKILQMAKKGILFAIAAGNDGPTSPPINPANMANASPNIYCVAACGPQKELAVYSSVRPYTTITAPGGNDPTVPPTNPTLAILSTFPVNLGGPYGLDEGTSMASPCFAGVLGILESAGGQPDEIRAAVIDSADKRGQAVPNPQFGYGVVDAYQAILRVAVSVFIVQPDGSGGKALLGRIPDPVETLRPTVVIRIRQIILANLKVTIDGTDIPLTKSMQTNIVSFDPKNPTEPNRYDITFDKDFAPGVHKIEVTELNAPSTRPAATDVRFFKVEPHVVISGRSMISIPFFQPNVTPEYYFGTDFRLARYLPTDQQYHFYSSSGPQDPLASFAPGDVFPRQDGDSTSNPKLPLGLAYWSDTESVKPVLTYGKAMTDRAFIIPLHGIPPGSASAIAWNMVGDPFPFDVPFNSLLVDTPTGRISIMDAVARGYLLPHIYSYDGVNGYTFRTLPDGALHAWEGHWVAVTTTADISLVVPPTRGGRAASRAPNGPTAADGWTMRLSVNSKNLHDTFNFIGASSRAVDGYDRNKVMKPPLPSPSVTLAVVHDDWATHNGAYAQDIRANGGIKTWNVVVSADQPNSPVTMSWDSAHSQPRTTKLTIKDETSGQVYDMRTRSGLNFNSGSTATTRRFTITSRPATGVLTRISNVQIQSSGGIGRAPGSTMIGFTLSSDASYDVKVLNATGANVGTVASRAASAGDVRLVWNGKDAAGRSVAAGTYIIQIRATGSDGDSVKVIQPFAVLR